MERIHGRVDRVNCAFTSSVWPLGKHSGKDQPF